MRRSRAFCLLLIGVALGMAAGGAAADDQDEALLGKSLSTLFNPRSAPAQKTMGLLQRSFLDLVEGTRPKLQIALVIDGTDSMSQQLQSVRQSLTSMMDDLELYKENNISYQLIVFRDAGSPSGEVQLPLQAPDNGFVADRAAVSQAVNNLKAESGAPYFPELVDEGLHVALTQLGWSTDDETSRWILLFGDAPPFDESFQEPANKAGRRFGSGALVAMAAEKGVRINCILCTSDPESREAHEKVLDQTRRFMNTLSTKTGGLMLDLTYDDIRNAVRKAAPAMPAEYEKIGWIKAEDVEQIRRQDLSEAPPASADRPLRVAILPHLPLDRMSFDPKEEAVRLATELRLRLRTIPGIEFKDSTLVKDRFRMVSRQGVEGEALLQMLATALDVDYVVWGALTRNGGAVDASTGFYDQATGRRLLQAKAATNPSVQPDQLGAQLADNLFKSPVSEAGGARLNAALASVNQDAARRNLLVVPAALGGGQASLLEGMESLDQSLALPSGDPQAAELLQRASSSLERCVETDRENPLARFLLASCLFNKAWNAQQTGDADAARQIMPEFARQLREAHRLRARRKDDAALRLEIEADHALLILGNVDEAIKSYQRMIEPATRADGQSVRRAYWMLAGIASGDWGVDQKYVDRDEAKRCLTQILAHWPDSSEAKFIRRALRWDDERGGAQFPHFPKDNRKLAEMIDRNA
jgi:tetratricopeptide (TPR) repeat protein